MLLFGQQIGQAKYSDVPEKIGGDVETCNERRTIQGLWQDTSGSDLLIIHHGRKP